ncbi:hypothetical protein BKA69DRAFT_1125742 [Paraphysoderma sedebokerense]|nr:hypothetical protein BKA69DRAFT_1125742 [Paraphysoderma sedebokerense]
MQSKAAPAHKRSPSLEALVDDLRNQVRDLSKSNGAMKSKLQYYKSQTELSNRKGGGSWDYVGSRIVSGQKRVTAVKAVPRKKISQSGVKIQIPEPSEEISHLQDIVSMLREKLQHTEEELSKLRGQKDVSAKVEAKSILEVASSKSEPDRTNELQYQSQILALQHELSIKSSRLNELHNKSEVAVAQHRIEKDKAERLTNLVADLNDSLSNERKKVLELEERVSKWEIEQKRAEELLAIIDELQVEKKLLKNEQKRFLDLNLSQWINQNNASAKNQKESIELRSVLEREKVEVLSERAEWVKKVDDLNAELTSVRKSHEQLLEDHKRLQDNLQHANEKLSFFLGSNNVSMNDFQEALLIMKWRKRKGLELETIMNAEEIFEDHQKQQDIRRDYLKAVNDLENLQKLMKLQEEINHDFKMELNQLREKENRVKNSYESRIEEQCHFLDRQQCEIILLKEQVRRLKHDGGEVGLTKQLETDFLNDLTSGLNENETVIVFCLHSFTPSSQISDYLRHPKIAIPSTFPNNFESLLQFFTVEFYEFETAVSTLTTFSGSPASSLDLRFDAKYRVAVDDSLLWYLDSKCLKLTWYLTNGVDYAQLGVADVPLSDILQQFSLTEDEENGETAKRGYSSATEIKSSDGAVLGQIQYSVHSAISLTNAVKAYRDRILALGFDNVTPKVGKEELNNEITVAIQKFELSRSFKKIPNIFVSFQLYGASDITTPVVCGSNTTLDFQTTIPITASSEFNRYLKTSKVSFLVFDDNEVDDMQSYVGTASVPLIPLITCDEVSGIWDIVHDNQVTGQIWISLRWVREYQFLTKRAKPDVRQDTTNFSCPGPDSNMPKTRIAASHPNCRWESSKGFSVSQDSIDQADSSDKIMNVSEGVGANSSPKPVKPSNNRDNLNEPDALEIVPEVTPKHGVNGKEITPAVPPCTTNISSIPAVNANNVSTEPALTIASDIPIPLLTLPKANLLSASHTTTSTIFKPIRSPPLSAATSQLSPFSPPLDDKLTEEHITVFIQSLKLNVRVDDARKYWEELGDVDCLVGFEFLEYRSEDLISQSKYIWETEQESQVNDIEKTLKEVVEFGFVCNLSMDRHFNLSSRQKYMTLLSLASSASAAPQIGLQDQPKTITTFDIFTRLRLSSSKLEGRQSSLETMKVASATLNWSELVSLKQSEWDLECATDTGLVIGWLKVFVNGWERMIDVKL